MFKLSIINLFQISNALGNSSLVKCCFAILEQQRLAVPRLGRQRGMDPLGLLGHPAYLIWWVLDSERHCLKKGKRGGWWWWWSLRSEKQQPKLSSGLYTHAYTAVCAHPPHQLTHILNKDAHTYTHSWVDKRSQWQQPCTSFKGMQMPK